MYIYNMMLYDIIIYIILYTYHIIFYILLYIILYIHIKYYIYIIYIYIYILHLIYIYVLNILHVPRFSTIPISGLPSSTTKRPGSATSSWARKSCPRWKKIGRRLSPPAAMAGSDTMVAWYWLRCL